MVSLAATERALGIVAPSAGGSLKRRHADASCEADAASSSQVKRRRVTFNPEVDVRIVGDDGDKSLELVGQEVRRALQKHAAGDKAAYDGLKGLFREPPTSQDAPLTGLLHKYLIALTNHVPLLHHGCKGLVHAVIDCSWIARNEPFVRSYRHFLRSLLSVHTGYMSTVLHMLVAMFLHPPSPHARHQDDPPVQRLRLRTRMHDTLKSILRHSPMASTFLAPTITHTFPFSDDDAKTHVEFIRNILTVTEYVPEIKGEILSLVTAKLVKIDVKMQVDMEDLDDDVDERLVGDAVNEDDDDDDLSDDASVSSEDSLNPEEARLKQIKDLMRKLDNIMDLQFAYYHSAFEKGDLFETDEIFESLLSQFANIILPTYRSRHTQFLLFHFSQTSTDLINRFAGCCSQLAFDQGRPQLLRASAAAYLASFIARGAHVSAAVVRDVFDLLCYHLEALRITHEPSCKGPDLRRYGTYYAISQALIYIFCFRWRDLIVTQHGSPPTDEDIIYHEGDFTWHPAVQDVLRRNIFCRLNPLKICAPTVVAQFSRMALHLRFMYIFPLIETNKRVRLAPSLASGYLDGIGGRETALAGKKGEAGFSLDAYFPFDPYVLPRSRRWVQGDYVEWKPVPGMPAEKDDDEEDGIGSGSEDGDSSEEKKYGEGQHDDLDDGSTEASL